MRLSALRPTLALLTFFVGAALVWWVALSWDRHVDVVNALGESPAGWGSRHRVRMVVNGKPINQKRCMGWALTMDKGCIPIYDTRWEPSPSTGPYTSEWLNLSRAMAPI